MSSLRTTQKAAPTTPAIYGKGFLKQHESLYQRVKSGHKPDASIRHAIETLWNNGKVTAASMNDAASMLQGLKEKSFIPNTRHKGASLESLMAKLTAGDRLDVCADACSLMSRLGDKSRLNDKQKDKILTAYNILQAVSGQEPDALKWHKGGKLDQNGRLP